MKLYSEKSSYHRKQNQFRNVGIIRQVFKDDYFPRTEKGKNPSIKLRGGNQ
jgi:hypothetical protein